jgi:hypothetical protein
MTSNLTLIARNNAAQAAVEASEVVGCHPSWLPRLLAVLHRDNPNVLQDSLCKAVTENAISRQQTA